MRVATRAVLANNCLVVARKGGGGNGGGGKPGGDTTEVEVLSKGTETCGTCDCACIGCEKIDDASKMGKAHDDTKTLLDAFTCTWVDEPTCIAVVKSGQAGCATQI